MTPNWIRWELTRIRWSIARYTQQGIADLERWLAEQ